MKSYRFARNEEINKIIEYIKNILNKRGEKESS